MHWLDRIIEEQAAHYGLPVGQFGALMHDAALEQERREKEGED
ncbi:hypothetical protein SB778_03785 [Paraburkholderia sp. SIMBA_050]